MVSGRPILLFSLPGVALILGVFWYRRRNKNHVENVKTGVDEKVKSMGNHCLEVKEQQQSERNAHQSNPQTQQTTNMIINGPIETEIDDNLASKLFGKSAPIKIVQNGSRGSPVKPVQSQNLNSEELRSKIEDAGHKTLRSIDEDFENLSSPVDLPDSVNHRDSFYVRNINCKQQQPVVIKATNTPKISPENSFLESKYTISSKEQNNNCAFGDKLPETKKNETKSDISESKVQTPLLKEDTKVAVGDEERKTEAASPSLSLCSVQSGDSGTGSSLPRSEAARAKTTYEFLYPISLIGSLYGRQRSYINKIKTKTNAEVSLRGCPYSPKLRICVVEGNEREINAALEMIRQKLPAKRYPNFTMERIHYVLPQTVVPLSTESLLKLQLNLIEGINNDVVVSTVMSGNHIFVQHPLHPTHPSLAVLQNQLNYFYTNAKSPLLPCIEIGAVCVMPFNERWNRVQIMENDPEHEMRCIVKFLDYGGYRNAHFQELRQINSDFMGLPFQATECFLSNIEPSEDVWYPEAADILRKLTSGILLHAQVAGYNSHNIPEINLYAYRGPNDVIFINKELAARNLAKWVEVRD